MPFPWMAAATIGAAGLGFMGQRGANRANARMAAENQEWQERMSSTAYQRSMLDKRAAGINPYYGLGSMSSTPAGNVIPSQNELGNAASTAMDVIRAKEELMNLRVTNEKLRSETETNRSLKKLYEKDAQQKVASAKLLNQQYNTGTLAEAVKGGAGSVLKGIGSMFTQGTVKDPKLGEVPSWLYMLSKVPGVHVRRK